MTAEIPKAKMSRANSMRKVKDPIANGALHSARQELVRADAAAHRAMNCVDKSERQRALRATIDHTARALTFMRSVNI